METDLIGIGDISDLGYMALTQHIQPQIKESGITEGKAIWIPCPTQVSYSISYSGSPLSLNLVYQVTSSEQPMAATLMMAKSMAYALYAGCLDLFKRQPQEDGGRKYKPGTTVDAGATIGAIQMKLTMAIGLAPSDAKE